MVRGYLKMNVMHGLLFFLPDSIVNVDKKYYPLVLSNECKYIVIKEKIRIMSAIVEELIINDFDDHDKLTKTKILS